MERRAVDAERDTDELKKAQFMADKIGEELTVSLALSRTSVCSLNFRIRLKVLSMLAI